MPDVVIRKVVTCKEEIHHEFGPPADKPLIKAAIIAVITNPFAGRYVEKIMHFMEDLKPLGLKMATQLLSILGDDRTRVQSYGKGAIIGTAGELEHGALWHAPGGYGMREVLGGTKAIVPSAKKVGGQGVRLDLPLAHIDAAYVRSHFDSMEVGIADAPRQDEICYILGMSLSSRIHNRAGGLATADIKGEDGLR